MAAIFGKKTTNKTSSEASAKPAEAKTNETAVAVQRTRGPLAKDNVVRASKVLIRPVQTEKTSRLEALGQYAFVVANDANKVEVAAAVRELYGVKPVEVRIVSVHGKRVRFGRTSGKRKNEKKAIVSLKPGDSLAVAEA